MGRPTNADRISRLCEALDIDVSEVVDELGDLMPEDEIVELALVQHLRGIGATIDYEILDADDPVQAKRDLAWFRERHGL